MSEEPPATKETISSRGLLGKSAAHALLNMRRPARILIPTKILFISPSL
jgi:hypothetical protein